MFLLAAPPVSFSIKHLALTGLTPLSCYRNVYYPSTGAWSQRGCIMNEAESTAGKTVCECNHLTHFAVLLSPGVEFGEVHEFALRTIGYIGITISLFAMVITVLINACFR